jgi:hypothetical protein
MRRTLLLALLATAGRTPAWPWRPTGAGAAAGAAVYRPAPPLTDYWVSEKYDGVRGFWDGRTLRTRGGERIAAPAWFTAGWPATPLDGELWAGRGALRAGAVHRGAPAAPTTRPGADALHGVRPAPTPAPSTAPARPARHRGRHGPALGAGRAATARGQPGRSCRRCCAQVVRAAAKG